MTMKDFYRGFRAIEKSGYKLASAWVSRVVHGVAPDEQCKCYLELADLAKRGNEWGESRRLLMGVVTANPKCATAWLEWSKLEDEHGNGDVAGEVLMEGLDHCELSEGLLVKGIRHLEKHGDLEGARGLISRLKNEDRTKVWRTVLEGAMLESRAGRITVARKVFKYLMAHVPWYGPIYFEAFRAEERAGFKERALKIVVKGLEEIPRYGPLWFGAFRIGEELGGWRGMVVRARKVISKELVWKVWYESALMSGREAMKETQKDGGSLDDKLFEARMGMAKAVIHCPSNLCWKVWMAGGRMELNAGRAREARLLLSKAFTSVPDKSKALVFLESARMEEWEGNLDLARAILCKARAECSGEWKVFLESVLLEIRCGNKDRATQLATMGIRNHRGTGRLWAMLVQLKEEEGEEKQCKYLDKALNEVPKSGEVWCEGARIKLNPREATFDLGVAEKYLKVSAGGQGCSVTRMGTPCSRAVIISFSSHNPLTNPFLSLFPIRSSQFSSRRNMGIRSWRAAGCSC